MAFNPNDEQRLAIKANGSVVVYAAAGSGKTAVLTQRVKKLICDKNPISADRILVVTFTRAAAAEMRGRIMEAVNKEIKERKEKGTLSENLLRQQMILSAANICTIDSFCSNLIRENFEVIGIDPEFQMADDLKIFEVSRSVIKEMVTKRVVSGDEDFKLLGDAIGIDAGLKEFCKKIDSIYNKSRSLPRPEKWLQDIKKKYGENGNVDIWLDMAFDIVKSTFDSTETLIDTYLYEIENVPDGMIHAETVNSEITKFRTEFASCLQNKDWDGAKSVLESTKITTIDQKIKKFDNWLYDYLRDLRVDVLARIDNLKKIFEYDSGENERLMKIEKRAVCALVDFVIEYSEQFGKSMLDEGYLTFDMVTHTAFSAVCEYDENDNIIPTEFGKRIAANFDAVLVDEYQDNNALQDEFFRILSDDGKNLFMVGDAKQSIYGFRNADPERFIFHRDNSPMYDEKKDVKRAKVVLDKNYRSRKEICDFANFLFGIIMQKETSGMDYTCDDFMNSKAEYDETDEKSVELHIVEHDKDYNAKIASAQHIVDYIKQTMAREPFLKDSNGGLRKAKYGDFAILMRSLKEKGVIFANALKQAGIPVSYNAGGIFETTEIMSLLSLLKAIDNPCDDISILATITGPIFAMSMDRVAEIRANNKADNFYGSLILAAQNNDSDVVDAFEKLKLLRRMSATSSVSEFILEIVDTFSFREIMSTYGEPGRRRANIDAFISIAEEFDSTSQLGLSSFLRMLESFIESDKKVESSEETDDAVTITTIHGSKGLEYPICILAETSSQFWENDTYDTVRIDEKLGISINVADLMVHKKYEPLSAKVIRRGMRNRLLAEEQRLLYVAITRAKEKLIIIIDGNEHNENKRASLAKSISHQEAANCKLSKENILSARHYADWIIMACQLHKDGKLLDNVAEHDKGACFDILFVRSEEKISSYNEEPIEIEADENIVKEISDKFSFQYPYETAVNTPTKTSVSKLLAEDSNAEYAFSRRPAIFAEDKMNAAEKGTATHKFLQYASYADATKDLDAEINKLAEWEYLSEQEINVLDRPAILEFLQSDLCKEIISSGMVLKEQRFLVPLNDGQGETVIQGAVDCVYSNEQGIAIVDFKTTRFETDQEFIDAYSRQLDIYADAMEQILDMKVTAKYIYSLHLSKTIKL